MKKANLIHGAEKEKEEDDYDDRPNGATERNEIK